MKKEKFIKELESITKLDKGKCTIVNSILESHFIIGKKNKEKMISDFIEQLAVTKEEAEKIYESAMSVIAKSIKDRLKHPFGSRD